MPHPFLPEHATVTFSPGPTMSNLADFVEPEHAENSPLISIIVLNLNGANLLNACLNSLLNLDYPTKAREIILVDNGSIDNSLEVLKKEFPDVKVVSLGENVGFARGCNAGALVARGKYLAFINNDARADPAWLKELYHVLLRHPGAACAAGKILSTDGQISDFTGGVTTFYGHAYQRDFHKPLAEIEPEHLEERRLLFACGGSMLVRHDVFALLDGFDDTYFAYFEDVDFGWRLNLCGYDVIFAPQAITFHQYHGTSGRQPEFRFKQIQERNALTTVLKNYEESNLAKIWPAALLLLTKRTTLAAGSTLNPATFSFETAMRQVGATDPAPAQITLPRKALGGIIASTELGDRLQTIMRNRASIQALRRRSDAEIAPLFQALFSQTEDLANLGAPYAVFSANLVANLDLFTPFKGSHAPKILLVTLVPAKQTSDFTEQAFDVMVSLDQRLNQLARFLATDYAVTLFHLKSSEQSTEETIPLTSAVKGTGPGLSHLAGEASGLNTSFLSGFQTIILPASLHSKIPTLQNCVIPVVLDLSLPDLTTILQEGEGVQSGPFRVKQLSQNLSDLQAALQRADFFLCATPAQIQIYLGLLVAQGRVNPLTFEADPTLQNIIGLVPPWLETKEGEKPTIPTPSLTPESNRRFKLIWPGPVTNNHDPLPLLYALATEFLPEVELLFVYSSNEKQSSAFYKTKTLAEMLALSETNSELSTTPRVRFQEVSEPVKFLEGLAENGGWVAISLNQQGLDPWLSPDSGLLAACAAGLPIITNNLNPLGFLLSEAKQYCAFLPSALLTSFYAELNNLKAPNSAPYSPTLEDLPLRRIAAAKALATHLAKTLPELHDVSKSGNGPLDWSTIFVSDRLAKPLLHFLQQPRLASDRQPQAEIEWDDGSPNRLILKQEKLIAELRENLKLKEEHLHAVYQGRLLRLLNWLSNFLSRS